MMGLENPIHLLVLFAIAMLLLGPKRIPHIARSLGSGIREFKGSVTGELEPPVQAPPEQGSDASGPAPGQAAAVQETSSKQPGAAESTPS